MTALRDCKRARRCDLREPGREAIEVAFRHDRRAHAIGSALTQDYVRVFEACGPAYEFLGRPIFTPSLSSTRTMLYQRVVVAHKLLLLHTPTQGRPFQVLMSADLPGWQDLKRDLALSRWTTPGAGARRAFPTPRV